MGVRWGRRGTAWGRRSGGGWPEPGEREGVRRESRGTPRERGGTRTERRGVKRERHEEREGRRTMGTESSSEVAGTKVGGVSGDALTDSDRSFCHRPRRETDGSHGPRREAGGSHTTDPSAIGLPLQTAWIQGGGPALTDGMAACLDPHRLFSLPLSHAQVHPPTHAPTHTQPT